MIVAILSPAGAEPSLGAPNPSDEGVAVRPHACAGCGPFIINGIGTPRASRVGECDGPTEWWYWNPVGNAPRGEG